MLAWNDLLTTFVLSYVPVLSLSGTLEAVRPRINSYLSENGR
jgi:hypothetical protein